MVVIGKVDLVQTSQADVPQGPVEKNAPVLEERGADGPGDAVEPEPVLEILPEDAYTTPEEEPDAVVVLAEENGEEELSIAETAPDLGGDDASAGELFEAPGTDLTGPDASEDGQKG
jgi:hypothetical protein